MLRIIAMGITPFIKQLRSIIPERYRWKPGVYFLILLATALDNFNVTATLIAQLSIKDHFGTTFAISSWVLSAYALTLGSFILLFGKLADILGPHNVFLFGVFTIWICSLITAAINNSIIALIIFRAFQGIGASALIPSGFALTANYFSSNPKHLQRAISGIIIALTASFGFGAIFGGAFDECKIQYKGLFYFVFASAFLLNFALLFLIIPITKTKEHEELKLANLNYLGVSVFIVGVLLIILGLTEGGESWKSPRAYVPIPVGFCMVISVFLFESVYIKNFKNHYIEDMKKGFNPKKDWRVDLDLLFPPECLKIPNFLVFLITVGFYYMAFTILMNSVIQYHLFVEKNSGIITACKLLPFTVGLVLSALTYNETLYKKIGIKVLLLGSCLLTLGSFVWLTQFRYYIENGYWIFEFGGLFLFGIGLNTFFNIYLNVVLSSTPLHLQGVVSGIYQTFAQVSLSIANALVASLLGALEMGTSVAVQNEMQKRFNHIHYLGYGFLAFSFFILLFTVDPPKESDEGSKQEP